MTDAVQGALREMRDYSLAMFRGAALSDGSDCVDTLRLNHEVALKQLNALIAFYPSHGETLHPKLFARRVHHMETLFLLSPDNPEYFKALRHMKGDMHAVQVINRNMRDPAYEKLNIENWVALRHSFGSRRRFYQNLKRIREEGVPVPPRKVLQFGPVVLGRAYG